MGEFLAVAKVSGISRGKMKLVDLGGEEVVVANVDGTFYAFGNLCPHFNGPLVRGKLRGFKVTCPWHRSVFDVKSGLPLKGPATSSVLTYQVRIEGDDIRIAKRWS